MTVWIKGLRYGEYPFDPNSIGILRLLKEKKHPKTGFAIVVGQTEEWQHTYGDKKQKGVNISVGRRCKRLIHDGYIYLKYTADSGRDYDVKESFASFSNAPKNSFYELSVRGGMIMRSWERSYFK